MKELDIPALLTYCSGQLRHYIGAPAILNLKIDPSDGVPIYQQIAAQIRYHVATGALKADDELPSVRALAAEHVINPNTVIRAYLDLEQGGVIYKRRGMGTYVRESTIEVSEEEAATLVGEALDKALVLAAQLGMPQEQLELAFKDRLQAFPTNTQER